MNAPVSLRGALLGAVLLSAGCADKALLENLDERQANEVVSVLLHNNIDADKRGVGKGLYVVDVGARDLAEAIELMQRHALPSSPRSRVAEAFPADALVSTPLAERARLISAVEQRLEESLLQVEGVRSTRVHLNYDANLGGEGRRPDGRRMHVAAVIGHAPGADTESLLQSIKRFLRNTFDGIDYDNVSVILTPVEGPRVMTVTADEGAALPWGRIALGGGVLLLGLAVVVGMARGGSALNTRLRGLAARLPDKARRRWRAGT